MSENHRIVLALSGSIAAYKGAALASDLVKSGHEVRCIMTSGARQFLAPLTLEALTGHKVTDDLWLEQPDGGIGHIELAKWASVLLVAPASASTLAHLAHGLADDALGAVALATEAPLVVAPAMESAMFAHLATQANLRLLLERGAHVVGPDSGRLASGAKGVGRMAEPSAILQTLARLLETRVDLRGSTVLVTAGPTYESIDWVRFLGNRSSGKMGYAVAEAALARGARVILITGPTALTPPRGVETIAVESADQMRGAVLDHVDAANVVIMAAAVADYRPAEVVDGKLRRSGELTLQLVPTPDIAADAAADAPHAVHVGFALEAQNLLESARSKLRLKGQDLVVANAISPENNPFGANANQVAFVTASGETQLPLLAKRDVAERLLDAVVVLMREKQQPEYEA